MTSPVPLAYFITFTCYGARLHGEENGSVNADHNAFGSPFLPPKPNWVRADGQEMREKSSALDERGRDMALRAIQEVCATRGWSLKAVHIRSNHAHLVVSAEEKPERILNDVKAYASRALSKNGQDSSQDKRWSRHGSTRYLWNLEQVGAAVHYVVREQGEPMAVWERKT